MNELNFFIRSNADPGAMVPATRALVRDIDPALPIYDVGTMEQSVAESVAQPRFYMTLLAAFAGAALLLAALGIYGVIAFTVSQRTRELGIRIALGATHERVVRLVLRRGMMLTTAGIAIGLLGAYWLTGMMKTLVFGVTPADPWTFVAGAVVLLGAAWLASYVPARRAARVDPVIAMRAE